MYVYTESQQHGFSHVLKLAYIPLARQQA
uniref:Uncharacterized protein MANES_09G161600 n=1 Tax=Rhizophora mucronata TaxID=61149 RepID=A0A2P2PPL6_RHIMU